MQTLAGLFSYIYISLFWLFFCCSALKKKRTKIKRRIYIYIYSLYRNELTNLCVSRKFVLSAYKKKTKTKTLVE